MFGKLKNRYFQGFHLKQGWEQPRTKRGMDHEMLKILINISLKVS